MEAYEPYVQDLKHRFGKETETTTEQALKGTFFSRLWANVCSWFRKKRAR